MNINKVKEQTSFSILNSYALKRIQDEALLLGTRGGAQHFLTPEASNASLGDALLDALDKSRFLTPEEFKELFHPDATLQRYKEWTQQLMLVGPYKTKKALFKQLKVCNVKMVDREIEMQPTNHVKLEGWDGINLNEVKIPFDSPAVEIGAALRLAFNRCE